VEAAHVQENALGDSSPKIILTLSRVGGTCSYEYSQERLPELSRRQGWSALWVSCSVFSIIRPALRLDPIFQGRCEQLEPCETTVGPVNPATARLLGTCEEEPLQASMFSPRVSTKLPGMNTDASYHGCTCVTSVWCINHNSRAQRVLTNASPSPLLCCLADCILSIYTNAGCYACRLPPRDMRAAGLRGSGSGVRVAQSHQPG
jgi:hypothetical protein